MGTGILGSAKGTWTIPGTNVSLPDIHVTENLADWGLLPKNGTFVNPVYAAESTLNSTNTPTGTPVASGGGGGGSWGDPTPNPVAETKKTSIDTNRYTAEYGKQFNVGDIVNGMRWDGSQWTQEGGGQGDMMAEINKAYDEGMGVLNAEGTRMQNEATTDEANLVSGTDLQKGKATTEGTQLTADTQLQQDTETNKITSALEGAIRAYNAMNQQRMARYGLGSSTGGAVGELAAQEYYRQQGGINQEKVGVDKQFINEFNKIKSYTKSKLDDLDQYKNEAVAALKKDLGNRTKHESLDCCP